MTTAFLAHTQDSVSTYEKLEGGHAKEIRYRPERQSVKDIFPAKAPQVFINGIPHRLDNISLTGLAVRGDETLKNVNNTVVLVSLRVGDTDIFAGEMLLIWFAATPQGYKAGLLLRGKIFDIAELQQLTATAHFSQRLTILANEENNTSLVPEEFKIVCAETLHLLKQAQQVLETLNTQTQQEHCVNACFDTIANRWHTLWEKANTILSDLEATDAAAFRAAKKYTESLVTPELIHAPVWKQAYEKPLGYPGDFRVMKHLYEEQLLGDTPYEKLCQALGLELGGFIRNRMHFAQQMISKIIAENIVTREDTIKIMNVGCGIPHEMVAYLREQDSLPHPLHFTMIDQEYQALREGYAVTYQAALRHAPKVQIESLHTSFMNLLRGQEVFVETQPQDLLYSLGIIDYLTPRRAQNFVAALYKNIRPGGTLLLANVREMPRKLLWPLGVILDWPLYYRTEEEMKELCALIEYQSLDIQQDETGQGLFMVIQKPL